jgi:ABC-type uncharacterized transport system involved in gliding motility auxiliary subunit
VEGVSVDRQRTSVVLGSAALALLVVGTTLWSTRAAAAGAGTPLIIAGLAALAVTAAINHRALFAFSRSRRARYGANAVLMTVFFIAIVVVVQAIAVRNSPRFDLTRNQRYTLAPQTLSVLDNLDADVTVTAFFRRASSEREVALDLLDLYTRRNPRVSVDVVDPDRQPHIATEKGASYDQVVFESGDRHRVVDRMTEEQFTNALVQVSRGAFKSVYFVTGHGEHGISSTERTGYAAAARALVDQGYLVQELTLLDVSQVPDDCEVLVVVGPFKRFLGDEIERIDLYLRRGGAALFMLEPWLDLPGVYGLLEDYGIALPECEIVESVTVTDNERDFGPRWTKVLRYQPHAITDGFRAATFYHSARPVQIVAPENDVRFDGSYLAISSNTAWGEVDRESFHEGTASRDGKDIAGPLPVAAVMRRTFGVGGERTVARLAVFGDADFANNANYGLLGNADFFQNTIAYLAGDEDLIAIRPREGIRDRVYITAPQGRLIFALCVFLLPLSVVGAGATVFFRNRKS